MNFLEMISIFLPGLAFMSMGFADDKSGGNGDDDKDKDKDDDGDDDDIDPTIKALQSDPDGIAGLLSQKRTANAEAKDLRLELKKLKDTKDLKDQDDLKKKGEFEKLSEKLTQESESRAEKFKVRMIQKELQVEAIALGVRNPKDVKLASMEGVDFNDDTFEVTGAKDAIEKLKKDSPYLFKDKKKGDEEEEEDDSKEAHEANKGKVKTNIKKFDPEKTDTRARFNLPFKEKKG